jgi:hypothetical protein
VLTVSISFILIYFFFSHDNNVENSVTLKISATPTLIYQKEFKTYTNVELGFSIDYQRLLLVKEEKDTGGYLLFVSFEANNFSVSHGFAVGVSKNSLEPEVLRIKNGFSEETKVRFSGESKDNVLGNSAIRFSVMPTNTSGFETKDVIVIQRDGYTYSISANPEEFDKVISSFKFLDPKSYRGFCGDTQVVCPEGFSCNSGVCIKN